MRNWKRNNIVIGTAISAVLIVTPVCSLADSPPFEHALDILAHNERATARSHAELATDEADLAGVQMHLHHALNCLVGPRGDGFDAAQMNPCASSGNGAIPDTTDAAKKSVLEGAADKIRAGIATTDLAEAKADATAAANAIKAVE